MVVRLPEMKKYLNRDGLEEYNSLLPHSSTEIQDYVDDWLDAHPEATTTVQDGSISTQKLADASVTRNKLATDVAHLLGGMMLTKKVQGEILTADDAYSVTPLSLEIDGKSTQDGTPTPDSPVSIQSIEVLNLPITFAGKNLLNLEAMISGYRTNQNGNVISGANYKVSDYIAVPPNTSFYVYHAVGSSYGYGVWQYKADKTPISYFNTSGHDTNRTFVTDANCQYLRISTYLNYTDCYLVLGNAPISYEPYVGITVNIPMQGSVLRSLPDGTHDTMSLSYLRESDRAGWAWYARELVQRVGHVADMGELTWDTFYNMFRTSLDNMLAGVENEISLSCTGFTGFPNKPINYLSNNMPNLNMSIRKEYTVALFKYEECESVELFKTAVTGMELNYLLANPITTQLNSVELPVLPAPNCTVYSDPTTGLKMSYMRDTNIVISDLEQAMADI